MNSEASDPWQSPPDKVKPPKASHWKVPAVVLAIGLAICIVGAVLATRQDGEIAALGEIIHRMGMVIVLAGFVSFLLHRRNK